MAEGSDLYISRLALFEKFFPSTESLMFGAGS
jgi:hypothetical protein